MIVTEAFLDAHPEVIFVYGDNLIHKGMGGAAALRHHLNSYGFITKKYPDMREESSYYPEEYRPVFQQEMQRLLQHIKDHPNKIYLISKLGSGLANRHFIFQEVIQEPLQELSRNHQRVYLVY